MNDHFGVNWICAQKTDRTNSNYSFVKFIPLIALLSSVAAHGADALTGLGDLPGGIFESKANGVSADGSVVVGYGMSVSGREAFRWTQASGMVGLGNLPGGFIFDSQAFGASADGSVVVGYGFGASGYEAFRWTQAGGMVGLGDLPGGSFQSEALGVSADGSVVVGYGIGNDADGNGFGDSEAFRWTQVGGMVGLGDLPGGLNESMAKGVSADGGVVVGYSVGGTGYEAFRWTQVGGMVGLGLLPGGFESRANGVSADGGVVVGFATNAVGIEAFRWTQAGGMVGLGDIPGGAVESKANGISADSSVIVGYGTSASGQEAFRWTQAGGMKLVSEWLGSAGVAVGTWALTDATGTNTDGSVIVGYGTNPGGQTEAYIARVSPIGSGIISPAAFMQSLASAGEIYRSGSFISDLAMNGSHHRPLMTYDTLQGDRCAWATGDFARHNQERDANVSLGEIGICGDGFNNTVRAGLGIGQGYVRQDLSLSGKNDMDGQHLIGEVNWRPAGTPIILSATALYGRWDAELSRGYLNGAVIDHSKGDTDMHTSALRGRLDWLDAVQLGGVSLNPWAALVVSRTKVEGYTESGGGFPVRFNSQQQTTQELRLGLTAEKRMSEATLLRATAETAHQFEDHGPSLGGQVIGLFSFNNPGSKNRDNWVRLGIDVDHKLGQNSLVSFTLNAASQGEDPAFSGAVSLRTAF